MSISSDDLTAELLADKTTKNTKVINPNTNNLSFGRIPQNNNNIPEGDIYLRLGLIGVTPSRSGAFGARHVWEKHKTDLQINNLQDIPHVVANILQPGSDILVDLNRNHDPHRTVVLNTSAGLVILEQKHSQTGITEYSIVTAYNRRNSRGVVIGKLEHSS